MLFQLSPGDIALVKKMYKCDGNNTVSGNNSVEGNNTVKDNNTVSGNDAVSGRATNINYGN